MAKKGTPSKPKPGADHPGTPSEYRAIPSKGEQHSHGHKYAAVPVTPRPAKKPGSK